MRTKPIKPLLHEGGQISTVVVLLCIFGVVSTRTIQVVTISQSEANATTSVIGVGVGVGQHEASSLDSYSTYILALFTSSHTTNMPSSTP